MTYYAKKISEINQIEDEAIQLEEFQKLHLALTSELIEKLPEEEKQKEIYGEFLELKEILLVLKGLV